VWVYLPDGLDVHHLVRVADGGTDEEYNLITLCHKCHLGRHQKNNHS
jgi:5-methylcytosine-specific restriction endonuclease McrA